MNPVCIFGHQINKEQLKGWYSIETQKRFCIHPKQAYALSHILCSFFLGRLLLTSIRWPSENNFCTKASAISWSWYSWRSTLRVCLLSCVLSVHILIRSILPSSTEYHTKGTLWQLKHVWICSIHSAHLIRA
jgi:hypothetical protein